jgi:hypothetical protein
MINRQRFGLFENVHWHIEGTYGKSLSIVCRSINIQTRNLSTLTLEHYRYANLLIAKAVSDASLYSVFIYLFNV